MAPVFLLGNPRSGTTLLRLMLTSHPQIAIPPECGFALWLQPAWQSWDAQDARKPERIRQFTEAVCHSRKFETWGMDISCLEKHIQDMAPDTYSALVACVYGAWAKVHVPDFQCWGDKNNYYIQHIPELLALYPQARMLHIVRDGRDVACSYLELPTQSSSIYAPRLSRDPYQIGQEWQQNVTTVLQQLSRLPEEQKMQVRYEDILESPQTVLTGIAQWLGLGFHPDMLSYHEKNRRQTLEPTEFLEWKARTLEPLDSRRAGRWKHTLSQDDQSKLTQLLAPTLQIFHYL